MIPTVRHIGIIVNDLDAAVNFFGIFLEIQDFKSGFEKGEYIDNVVGLENVEIEWVKLVMCDGFIIELLKYNADLGTVKLPQIGAAHIAFTVENINKLYLKLINKGYMCNSVPQVAKDKKAKFLYCDGPEGIVVELVEEIHE